jgi:hypothetical protein
VRVLAVDLDDLLTETWGTPDRRFEVGENVVDVGESGGIF